MSKAMRRLTGASAKAGLAIFLATCGLGPLACQSTPPPAPAAAATPAPAVQPARPKAAVPGDSKTLYFDAGQSGLSASQLTTLQDFAGRVVANPALRLNVVGYRGAGGADGGKRLPEQRAKNVASYLTSRGIPPRNITLRGDASAPASPDDAPRAVVTVR